LTAAAESPEIKRETLNKAAAFARGGGRGEGIKGGFCSGKESLAASFIRPKTNITSRGLNYAWTWRREETEREVLAARPLVSTKRLLLRRTFLFYGSLCLVSERSKNAAELLYELAFSRPRREHIRPAQDTGRRQGAAPN